MHRKEGQLRAYLDSQVSPEESRAIEEHLKTCEACHQRLEALRLRSGAVASALDALAEPAGSAAPSVSRAFAQFQDRIERESESRRSVTTMWNRMTSGRWRAAWATVTAVVVLALFVFYPPLRTAASEFLGVFRARKFAAIPINLSVMEDDPTFASIVESALSDQVEMTKAPGPLTKAESAEEASVLAGFRVRLPGWLPDTYIEAPTMQVADETSFRVTVNGEYVRLVQEALGKADIPVPEGLDGARVDVAIPKVFTANYPSERGSLLLIQAPSPEIALPASLDMTELGTFALRLADTPESEALRLAQTIDWASTLVIPVPMQFATYAQVSVAGAEGLVISERSGPAAPELLLVFERDGIVYGVQGRVPSEDLIAIAESMF